MPPVAARRSGRLPAATLPSDAGQAAGPPPVLRHGAAAAGSSPGACRCPPGSAGFAGGDPRTARRGAHGGCSCRRQVCGRSGGEKFSPVGASCSRQRSTTVLASAARLLRPLSRLGRQQRLGRTPPQREAAMSPPRPGADPHRRKRRHRNDGSVRRGTVAGGRAFVLAGPRAPLPRCPGSARTWGDPVRARRNGVLACARRGMWLVVGSAELMRPDARRRSGPASCPRPEGKSRLSCR